MNAIVLYYLFNSNPKALSEDAIIRTLKTEFRALKALGLWISAESNKVDMDGDMYGLKLAINKLVESQKRGYTGRNG